VLIKRSEILFQVFGNNDLFNNIITVTSGVVLSQVGLVFLFTSI